MYKRVGSTNSTGFTIVELLIVVVVIAVLAAISIVAYNGITSRSNNSAAQSSAQQIGKKIATLVHTNGSLPATLGAVGFNNSGNITYQYTLNNSSQSDGGNYCATVTAGSHTYHIAGTFKGTIGPVVQGPCNNHIGAAPTVAINQTTNQPEACPANYVVVPGNSLFATQAFCVMKFEAKILANDVGTTVYSGAMVPDSRATGTPWTNITQHDAIAEAQTACSGCRLITDNEWLTIAHNVLSVASNWTSGIVGTGSVYSGHNDNAPSTSLAASSSDLATYTGTGESSPSGQRRTHTLNNGQIIWDLSGNVWEWTSQTIQGVNSQPGPAGGATAWREWNAANVLPGNFTSSFPGYGTTNAAAWTGAANSLGQFYASNTESRLAASIRGGVWDHQPTLVGVMTFALQDTSGSGGHIGFRVTR